MFANPYVVLGLVVAWGASVVGSFFYGQRVEAGAQALAQQNAIVATFEQTRRDAEAERGRAVAEAERRGKAQAAVRTITRRIVETRTVPAECIPDDFRMSVNAAIDAANGTGADPGGVPVAVPGAADARPQPQRVGQRSD